MTSADFPHHADTGLLSPVQAGTAVEALTSDAACVRALLAAEAALARAQVSLGLAPAGVAEAISRAATAPGRFDPYDLAVRARAGANPVIALVHDLTAAVAEADPGAAAYVHRGATSQDILDTAMMTISAQAVDHLLTDLARVAGGLGRLARAHRDTTMAGRTLTQHAVPTTFGLKAAGWRSLVLDAHDRLTAVRSALPAQLGGAAGTLAAFHAYAEAEDGDEPRADGPFGEDVGLRLCAAFARETGLAEPALPWHVLRTPVAELGGALALASGALGKIAADVLVLSRTEIGEVTEGTGGTSSAMPHKANPARATLIAGAARRVPALTGVLYACLVAEDERPSGAWHAEWPTLRDALRTVGGMAATAADLVAGLRVHPDRMRGNLGATHGQLTAERLVAALAPLAGRAEARAAVTRAGDQATREAVGLPDSLSADPAVTRLLTSAQLHALADPSAYHGSAAALVDRALRRPDPAPEGEQPAQGAP
ncbi:3-carboxy-cis,cis-muconate cycloisomerase [Streptomyces sp. LP11]|uniref:3-carboxy-cis,cis-muconate cycloisomerase n=1 Tax=Streptomyces pyxinicus TaxID=2970331 RepID=A0ABT2B549_9ACTN|nr:3-carboxy-cis,cis-muconate cycloisomerase [Streptomyces sp. LP11]MCS0603640.1 3-carboxy-cis,cis-muconate cycloisomerase [Streptomyces sp. LP11]